MSTATRVVSASNYAITNYDTSIVFLGNNEFAPTSFSYTNSTYDTVVLLAGNVVGLNTSDVALLLESGASDGSQLPYGILAQDVTVAAGETFSGTVSLCVKGRVSEGKLGFQGSDDLDTVIDGRTLRARIAADTVGIKLSLSEENTKVDNQP